MSNHTLFSRQLSKEDSIGNLNLSIRSTNALKRSGIQTIGEVIDLVELGLIGTIHGLGKKCILEIDDCLSQLKSGGEAKKKSLEGTTLRIGQLNLSNRSFNGLRNIGVKTVSEVVKLVESGEIQDILGLGSKSISEIKDKLAKIEINDSIEVDTNPDVASSLMNLEGIPDQVISWQLQLVSKQLSMELLHEHANIMDRPLNDWLAEVGTIENYKAYEVLAQILSSSLNISEEIEYLLNLLPGQHYLLVMLLRYGFERKTLGQIGKKLKYTRERIRQLDNELKEKLCGEVNAIVEAKSIKNLKGRPTLLRMQSSLLIAGDMGLDMSYHQWAQRIRSSGLVGNWKSENYLGKDVVEVMVAICNLLADQSIRCLQIPLSLQYTLQLVNDGQPHAPAKIKHVHETLPDDIKKLINRHINHSGGVYAIWLSQEIGRELEDTKIILRALGYKMLFKDWFIPRVIKQTPIIAKNHVFHKGLRKMFFYCGPVSIDDVCSGLQHVLSRSEFPVPPPDVMQKIIRIYDYKCQGELYYWEGVSDETLSTSETVIMNCVDQIGPVVHRSELVHAFKECNLSVSSLSATLNFSPLFKKIELALYTVRGRSISYHDIERAKFSRD